jgi:hypothetical protein
VTPFGEDPDLGDARDLLGFLRRAIAVVSESVWVAGKNEYALELWHPHRGSIRTIRRAPPWTDPSTFVDVPEGHDPRPSFLGLYAEGDSLLWVAAQVFRSEFPSFGGPIDPVSGHTHIGTVIEVLDSRTGQLLATAAFDDIDLLRSIGGAYWSATRDADGIPVVDIYKLTLMRTP